MSNIDSLSQKSSQKQIRKRPRQEFLLTLFDKPYKLEHKEVNGFVLFRYFNNSSHEWNVAIYTPESWQKAQEYLSKVPAGKTYDTRQTTMLTWS